MNDEDARARRFLEHPISRYLMEEHSAVDCPCGVVPDKFTLAIELGNERMTSPRDVAEALAVVAKKLASSVDTPVSGQIRDINGNLVGQWRFQ